VGSSESGIDGFLLSDSSCTFERFCVTGIDSFFECATKSCGGSREASRCGTWRDPQHHPERRCVEALPVVKEEDLSILRSK
jgi:hypothetical protein